MTDCYCKADRAPFEMYKPQASTQRHLRDSWQEVHGGDIEDRPAAPKSAATRRSSAPITIFSVYEELEPVVETRGILPGHVDGVFRGVEQEDSSFRGPSVMKCQPELEPVELTKSDDLTSLGSVLEEVLESVDAAEQSHHRARSDSRIADWLGEQSSIQTEKKRKCSEEERQRIKHLTRRILRDLLGVDKAVLEVLFGARLAGDQDGSRAAKEIEMKIWHRWVTLARRDTASLASSKTDPRAATAPPATSAAMCFSTRNSVLEKIPWGIPEDPIDEEYWNEGISLPMVYRFLKSCLMKNKSAPQSPGSDDARDERAQKFSKTVQTDATQTEASTTVTGESTTETPSTVGSFSTSRLAFSHLTRGSRRPTQRSQSRSRTSRSSSFRTASHAGSCSVASMRRSALGSNFWDLGSLGGASMNSREVGNWSVYT